MWIVGAEWEGAAGLGRVGEEWVGEQQVQEEGEGHQIRHVGRLSPSGITTPKGIPIATPIAPPSS